MSEEVEPKYPDLRKMTRSERDMLIFQSIEAVANELARLGKLLSEIHKKI